ARVDQDLPLRTSAGPYSSSSEVPSSTAKPKKRRPRRARRPDGQDEFPRITNEDMRVAYKREFDRDHQEYKDLQAELDAVNRKLSDVDKELDDLQQGSPQF
ncbi:hypothetical protein CRUP_017111, partial [Coryphaenoides rupestris]